MTKAQYKIIKQDNNSISCYFKYHNQTLYADVTNVYNLFNEFMVYRCNQRWVVSYSDWIFVKQTEWLTEKEFIECIELFKSYYKN